MATKREMTRKDPKWPPNPKWPPKIMIFYFNTHSYVRLIRVFLGGNFISDSIFLNKSMLKAQDGDQIQDGRDI